MEKYKELANRFIENFKRFYGSRHREMLEAIRLAGGPIFKQTE
jgi:hypothetical protein